MKRATSKTERIAKTILYLVLAGGFVLLFFPCNLTRILQQKSLTNTVSNGRQIKLIMDAYAMDNDGVFPSEAHAEFYGIPASETSNDLFKQLFAGAYTESQQIFWIKDFPLCNRKRPDDVTTTGGRFDPGKTLQAGDNAWAYVENQSNTDPSSRPILVTSPPSASGLTFDPEQWTKKVIVVRIDGTVRAERLNPDNKLLDGDNKELLTLDSDVWDPAHPPTIAYPIPAK